jgi:hypothetical protein
MEKVLGIPSQEEACIAAYEQLDNCTWRYCLQQKKIALPAGGKPAIWGYKYVRISRTSYIDGTSYSPKVAE